MSKVLVTGARGFVGRHLCDLLRLQGHAVLGAARSVPATTAHETGFICSVGDIGDKPDWSEFLEGVDCVVHLAARVHVMRDVEVDPLEAFRRVNVRGTEHLARSAGLIGVKRFIYLSTIKTHGDVTVDRPFSMSDALVPTDPYAKSKLEAERSLIAIGSEMKFESVIIRPPLVYGPGVRGNFGRLLSLIDKGIPLPFGRINNSRSLVGVENLCRLISECITNPAAADKRFLVSDNEDVSTPVLLGMIASAMCRPTRLLPVPVPMLTMAAKMFGQSPAIERLTSSLQVDIEDTMQVLNWQPSKSVMETIESTVSWYQEQKNSV